MTTKLSDKAKKDIGEFLVGDVRDKSSNPSFKDMDLYVNRDTKQLTQKALDIIEASPMNPLSTDRLPAAILTVPLAERG